MTTATTDPFVDGLRAIFEAHSDLTPSGLSTAAGLDNSTVRKLLSGASSSPKHATMLRIAEALGMTVETIVDVGLGRIAPGTLSPRDLQAPRTSEKVDGFMESGPSRTRSILENLDRPREHKDDLKIGTDGRFVQVIATVDKAGLTRLIKRLEKMLEILEE